METLINKDAALQDKAAELIAMAAGYGVEARIQWETGFAVMVSYGPGNLWSIITRTETGRVSVKSHERMGRRTESVSLKNLPEYVEWVANGIQRELERAENVRRWEREKEEGAKCGFCKTAPATLEITWFTGFSVNTCATCAKKKGA